MSDFDETDNKSVAKCAETAYQQLLAYTYLDNCDKTKYGTLLTGLQTQQSLKNNQYPKTITEANNVLSNHHFDKTYNANKRQQQDNKSKEQSKDEKDKD